MNRRAIDVIEGSVKVPDVLDIHGIKHSRGRCVCPICHGNSNSFSYTPEVYNCFRCGSAGGVIHLEAALSGTTMDEACYRLARAYGLDIAYREPTPEEIENEELNREIEKDYREYNNEKERYYKGLSRLYRHVWKELVKQPKDAVLLELEKSLAEWLDNNIEEVVTPWDYQPSQQTIFLMELSRSNS